MPRKLKVPGADPLAGILSRAKAQGRMTVSELSTLLPAGTSVDDTLRLIQEMDKHRLPLLTSEPPRPARENPLLTREQEVAFSRQIRAGLHRRIQAATRSPRTAQQVLRAAQQAATGSCPIWDILADYEGSDPERDAHEAAERLRGLAGEIKERLRTWRALAHRPGRGITVDDWQRLDQTQALVSRTLLELDFRDTFIDRLLLPITAAAARTESARQALTAIEQRLRLAPGALGDCGHLPDRTARQLFREAGLPAALRAQALREFKKHKRAVRQASVQVELAPRDLLEVAAEIRRGVGEAAEARRRLVEANQRLVFGIAHRYPLRGLDFVDLVQEGNLGLMRAADRFNPELGFRFGTYAVWWVRQSIGRLLAEQGGSVRIPPHVQEALHKLNRLSRRHVMKTGREPSVEELADRMGKTPERIKEILWARNRVLSADTPVGGEDDAATLLDFIPDPHAHPDEEADRRVRQTVLQHALDALNPREREIVSLRFLDGLTLQEVGERFGITRERTRQLQEQAIRKLRRRIRADLLRRLTRDSTARAGRKKLRTAR